MESKRSALIATPKRTQEIMQTFDLKTKKSLGQNFIIDSNILYKMVKCAEIDPSTHVIEIGPGIGALTEVLAQHAKQVTAFEIDNRFIKILKSTLKSYNNVNIIHQDILKVDFNDSAFKSLVKAERLVVVANLPYYITTPIIMYLISSGLPFKKMVMMMQKEVAERLTASVGTKAYSSLTLAIEMNMEGHIAFTVPKTVFLPQPNVDSAVLVLERLQTPKILLGDQADLQAFIQIAFTQRRKTLWNNLRHYSTDLFQELDESVLQLAFQDAGIMPARRAETLTLGEFNDLYKAIQKRLNEI